MQDHLPSSLVIPAGTVFPTVPEATPAVGALSSAQTGDLRKQLQTDPQLDDFTREQAIARAAALVEFFHAEAGLYEALWRAHSDFGHKAAYDLAYSNAHKARELMESLVMGRSARQVAKLERDRGLDLPACANEERAR